MLAQFTGPVVVECVDSELLWDVLSSPCFTVHLPITPECLVGADNKQAGCHLLLFLSSIKEMESALSVIAECRWGQQAQCRLRST